MKNIFSSRRNKSPHNKEETEKKEAPFFSKKEKTPFFSNVKGAPVQAKLTVGQPGDKYEKEADSMADAVVNKTATPEIQNKEISSIQRESLATPLEDEKLGTAEQRMEEDKLVQEKPELQRMEEPEEEMVQQMEGDEEEGMVNKMEDEEEESVQAKSNGKSSTASPGLSQQIKSKSGKGRSMSKSTQSEMESSFNTDFTDVNIHTDHDAVKMNKELGAQAFTHGKDVYFNSGKYSPESSEGKRLLAHELTHVVQQKSGKKIQMQRRRRRRRVPDRQRVFVVRDRGIGLGGTYVPNLTSLKRRLMTIRDTGEWTLVIAIHGSEDILAAQSPPNWQRDIIRYDANRINELFSSDPEWVTWRNQYGPNFLSLVSCQVSVRFEQLIISNLTRNIEGSAGQSAQGLGEGCKPLAYEASLEIHARSIGQYNRMSEPDQARFLEQLRRLNRRFGYYGQPPVPENQILDYFFNEAPRARWMIVEVTHNGVETGIPFWNRSSGPNSSRFMRLCDQGLGRLIRRRSNVPPARSN